ncbi:hypothetical protein FACS189492_2210 [Clostridia bacterium]|nr:hypothetical protein FACS189492_2210 [Clostridia bacterium]
MLYYDYYGDEPIGYCACCGGEIYAGDEVYDMGEIYQGGARIIHEDCLGDSLEENKDDLIYFFFSDPALLSEVMGDVLIKQSAREIFGDREDRYYDD